MPPPKWTPDQVSEMRRRYRAGERVSEIASSVERDVATVRSALLGDTYGWVLDERPLGYEEYVAIRKRAPAERGWSGQGQPPRWVPKDLAAIRVSLHDGMSIEEIAARYGVSTQRIRQLMGGGSVSKSRQKPGKAIFTAEQIADMRQKFRAGERLSDIAGDFLASAAVVRAAIIGTTYRWVSDEPPVSEVEYQELMRKHAERTPTGSESGIRWTTERLLDLQRQHRDGKTLAELAEAAGVSRARIHALLKHAEKIDTGREPVNKTANVDGQAPNTDIVGWIAILDEREKRWFDDEQAAMTWCLECQQALMLGGRGGDLQLLKVVVTRTERMLSVTIPRRDGQ